MKYRTWEDLHGTFMKVYNDFDYDTCEGSLSYPNKEERIDYINTLEIFTIYNTTKEIVESYLPYSCETLCIDIGDSYVEQIPTLPKIKRRLVIDNISSVEDIMEVIELLPPESDFTQLQLTLEGDFVNYAPESTIDFDLSIFKNKNIEILIIDNQFVVTGDLSNVKQICISHCGRSIGTYYKEHKFYESNDESYFKRCFSKCFPELDFL